MKVPPTLRHFSFRSIAEKQLNYVSFVAVEEVKNILLLCRFTVDKAKRGREKAASLIYGKSLKRFGM